MKLILSGINIDLLNAWSEYFGNEPEVAIIAGDITELQCDAVVSPANSFGFMDGGLDYALSVRFGWDLEKVIQAKIAQLPERELLVGKAMVTETNDAHIPYLITAPTMRIPTNFNIDTSVNAYLAMKALLIVANDHEKINIIAVPGLCTGVGRMPPSIAAKQMFSAYCEVIKGEWAAFSTFGEAQKNHWDLNQNGMIWTH